MDWIIVAVTTATVFGVLADEACMEKDWSAWLRHGLGFAFSLALMFACRAWL